MRAKYILSELMVGLWRNGTMTAAMIITMSVSLTMLGASLVLYHAIHAMKGYYYDKVACSICLRRDHPGHRGPAAGRQHDPGRRVQPAARGGGDEAGRRLELVHPVAVRPGGDVRRDHRRGGRRARADRGQGLVDRRYAQAADLAA